MKKRTLLILTLLVLILMPAGAVYNEENVEQTIHVLHYELKDRYENIAKQNKLQRDRTRNRILQMDNTIKKANNIALMLYSQKAEYIFGLTYACDLATDLYNNFIVEMQPLVTQEKINANDVCRYDSIINVLTKMDLSQLSPKSYHERQECIFWAKAIKSITIKRDVQTKASIRQYYKTKEFLYNLNVYAQDRYRFVQDKLFNNGSETFHQILQNWDDRWPYLKTVTTEEYSSGDDVPTEWGVNARTRLMTAFCIGALLALIAGWLITFFLRRNTSFNLFVNYVRNWARECPVGFTLASGSLLFAIGLTIARVFITQNFFVMALDLMMVFSWVFAAILIASFFMKAGENAKQSMYLYASVLLSGLLVIFLRIYLFPNLVVAFILPPVILLCAIWEMFILHKVWKDVAKIDRALAVITELIYIGLVFCSWNGYILFTVQILTWWMMQLACILVLTSLGMSMRLYGMLFEIHDQPIKKSWPYYFVCMLVCPVAALYSLLLSAYWGGNVFNIGGMVTDILESDITGNANVTVSLWTVISIINMWLVARFIYFIAKQVVMKGYDNTRITFEQGQSLMYTKVIEVLVYGVWFLVSLYLLHVSMTWITAAFAGLCTGLAFASKTILENIFYGLSLLSGQLKIGDLIKIGDVYGNVLNISYSNTVVRNDDGTVVTFTNSQLFEMNYRNLTRIDEFNKELLYLNVGIKTDIAKVRQVIVDATSNLPCLHLHEKRNGKPAYQVGVRTTGVNSFELASSIIIETAYWVDPVTEKRDIGIVTECIINALRENNIEIL